MGAGRWAGVILLGLACGGCALLDEGAPEVLRIKEVVGTIQVAENAEAELRSTDTDRGIKLLSTGALLKIPEGGRVRLDFIQRACILWLHGPGEFEIGPVRLERSDSGIHGEVRDIHATFLVHQGVIAGAMEGPPEKRPSIEVSTSYASARLDPYGMWAVVVDPKEKAGGEAWVRDVRGPEAAQRLLLHAGDPIDFPPNGVLFWTHDQGPTPEASDDADRDFVEAFLEGLTIRMRDFEGLGQLLDECSWKRIR